MTRGLGILLGAVVLLVVIIIGIYTIGNWLDYQTNGPKTQPITSINTRHGDVFDVYDIDITGQPCLLLQHGEKFALSCAWDAGPQCGGDAP